MEENTTINSTLKVKISHPVAFNPVGDISITNTEDLSKIINDIFFQTFSDYYGCQLTVQFQPERQCYIVVPMLYFRVLKKEQYNNDNVVAFKPIGADSNSSNIIGRVQLLSQTAASGQKVAITDDAKSVLNDFIINPVMKNQKFDWTSAFRTIPTESDTFIQVFKLDINKFITKIFGEKDETGSALYYQITPAYVIGAPNQYKKPDKWSLHILRLHHDNEARAAEMLGMYIPNQGSEIQGVVTELTVK